MNLTQKPRFTTFYHYMNELCDLSVCVWGLDNTRPLIHEHCKKLLVHVLLLFATHDDHFTVAKLAINSRTINELSCLNLAPSNMSARPQTGPCLFACLSACLSLAVSMSLCIYNKLTRNKSNVWLHLALCVHSTLSHRLQHVMQPIRLVDYLSLKKSIWRFCRLSRRLLNTLFRFNSFFSFLFLLLFSMFVFISVWCHYVWRPRALVVRLLSKSTDLIWFETVWGRFIHSTSSWERLFHLFISILQWLITSVSVCL